ncbi:unnamed protein product [Sphagnum balticum]
MGRAVRELFGESEVSDAGRPVADEDIGQLQVAVQEVVLSDLEEPPDDVPHDACNFLFPDFASFLEDGAEISLVAKLGDDVAVGRLPDDIITFENVGVFQFGKCFNFALEHFSAGGVFDSLHVYGFDGDCFVYVIGAILDD